MTKEEMRELDVFIAQKVFGKEVDFVNQWIINRFKDGGRSVENLPQYTLDKAAAMQVLERCVKECWRKNHSDVVILGDKSFTVAWRLDDYDYTTEHDSTAETLPLAICLFAKKLFSQQ